MMAEDYWTNPNSGLLDLQLLEQDKYRWNDWDCTRVLEDKGQLDKKSSSFQSLFSCYKIDQHLSSSVLPVFFLLS
jgi:hypothetical protein